MKESDEGLFLKILRWVSIYNHCHGLWYWSPPSRVGLLCFLRPSVPWMYLKPFILQPVIQIYLILPFVLKMLLNTRGTVSLLPADELITWVSGEDIENDIGFFLTTLIVYDAGECSDHILILSCLTFIQKFSHSTKRLEGAFLAPYTQSLMLVQVRYFWVSSEWTTLSKAGSNSESKEGAFQLHSTRILPSKQGQEFLRLLFHEFFI